MKTTSIFFIFFLLTHVVYSQQPCKSYTNVFNLLNGTYDTTYNVFIEKRTKSQIFMSGGGDYKIYSGDKKTDKIIKSKLFAVEVNDTLYINLRRMKYKKHVIGPWFAPAIIRNNSIYLTAIPVGSNAATAFGVIGAAAESSNAANNRVYYELSPKDKTLRKVDTQRMEEVLKDHTELLEQYKKEVFKEHIEIIFKYLHQM